MLNKWLCCDIDETEEEFATRLANNLENLILKEGPETVNFSFCFLIRYRRSVLICLFMVCWYTLFYFQIAAFIAEPVMGAGGVIPPPKTYFEKVNYNIIMNLIFFLVVPKVKKSLGTAFKIHWWPQLWFNLNENIGSNSWYD
jgi:hypothetical protein